MPVEYTVDSLDTVDESIRGAYVPSEDGKFNFDPDKYAEVKIQASGLKNKNSELIRTNKQIKEAQKRYEPFATLTDQDLQEILEWRENKDKNPQGDGKPQGDLKDLNQKALQREKDGRAADKAEFDKQLSEVNKELRHFKLTVPIRDAAAKAGVMAEDMEVVLLDTAGYFDLNEDGKPVVLQDGEPSEITLEKFFNTLYREKRPKFYAASGASGSGAPSTTASRGGKKIIKRSEFDTLDQFARAAKIKDGYKVED